MNRPIVIVEDSDDDFYAVKRILQKAGFVHEIIHCEDGDEALDYFFGKEGSHPALMKDSKPLIILLDLNLPGIDGHEVLARIKADESLKTIPVIVFSTSTLENDINRAYEAGANTFVHKPVKYDEYEKAVVLLKNYWIDLASTASLPNGSRF